MSKLNYTKSEVDILKSNIYFTKEEEKILDMWLYESSIIEMSLKLNMSTATISRKKKNIKNKIDDYIEKCQNQSILILNKQLS